MQLHKKTATCVSCYDLTETGMPLHCKHSVALAHLFNRHIIRNSEKNVKSFNAVLTVTFGSNRNCKSFVKLVDTNG